MLLYNVSRTGEQNFDIAERQKNKSWWSVVPKSSLLNQCIGGVDYNRMGDWGSCITGKPTPARAMTHEFATLVSGRATEESLLRSSCWLPLWCEREALEFLQLWVLWDFLIPCTARVCTEQESDVWAQWGSSSSWIRPVCILLCVHQQEEATSFTLELI